MDKKILAIPYKFAKFAKVFSRQYFPLYGNRLLFGIASAPGIFQRVMDSLLQGIPGVVVYLNDILVTGPSDREHLESLKEVLRRLENAGLRLNKRSVNF